MIMSLFFSLFISEVHAFLYIRLKTFDPYFPFLSKILRKTLFYCFLPGVILPAFSLQLQAFISVVISLLFCVYSALLNANLFMPLSLLFACLLLIRYIKPVVVFRFLTSGFFSLFISRLIVILLLPVMSQASLIVKNSFAIN